jgi:drug/metabolite transporter (DMT)-like permease
MYSHYSLQSSHIKIFSFAKAYLLLFSCSMMIINMSSPLAIAILAGLGGMVGWGLADFFAKKTVDVIGPIKSLVWAHVFGTVTLILAAVTQMLIQHNGIEVPVGGSVWLGLVFFGVLQMIVYWLAYQGFEKGQLAIMSPVFASYSGLVALVAIIAFGEHASGLLIAALVVLFAGIMLVNVDMEGLRSRRLKIAPGMKEMAAAAVLATIWTLGWDKFVEGQDPLPYALYMYAFMSLAAVCLARLMKEKLSGIPKNVWKFLALSGIGEAVAYFSITRGYSATSLTSVVALISGAFTVPTIILAYIFLKERITRLQVVAVVLIVAGIIIVSLNG